MNKSQVSKLIRKWHRKLGVFIGIQLMLWSLGGVVFSWIHIENVRGNYEAVTRDRIPLNSETSLYSPSQLITESKLQAVNEVRLGYLLDEPVYRLYYDDDEVEIYNAVTGELISPISESLARKIAAYDFLVGYEINQVEMVYEKSGEYKKSVPAFKIHFDHWKNPHVYVHANSGEVTARRNGLWRLFDFFWMLHIMDYGEREDFNHLLLKGFSLLGVLTVSSGFTLFFLTTPLLRRKANKSTPDEKGSESLSS